MSKPKDNRTQAILLPERLCRKGLHDLNNPANVYTQPSNGVHHCDPCRRTAKRLQRLSNLERERARNSRNYYAKQEYYSAQQRAWRETNADRVKETRRLYGQANRELCRQQERARRARLANVPSEPYTFEQVVAKTDGLCHLCWTPVDLTLPRTVRWGANVDHIIPLVAKGPDTLLNVALAHRFCNLSKGARVA